MMLFNASLTSNFRVVSTKLRAVFVYCPNGELRWFFILCSFHFESAFLQSVHKFVRTMHFFAGVRLTCRRQIHFSTIPTEPFNSPLQLRSLKIDFSPERFYPSYFLTIFFYLFFSFFPSSLLLIMGDLELYLIGLYCEPFSSVPCPFFFV